MEVSSDRELASRWTRRQQSPWKKNVAHLWGWRQQLAEAVGLTDDPTVQVTHVQDVQIEVAPIDRRTTVQAEIKAGIPEILYGSEVTEILYWRCIQYGLCHVDIVTT